LAEDDMKNCFCTKDELKEIGFKKIGKNVLISRKASIYGASNISIGSNVRIDDFCILTGKIEIGNYVHIAPYTALTGGTSGVFISDFANLSRKIEVFAVSDDFTEGTLTNPMVPDKYKNMKNAPVFIRKHVLIGPGSVVLPGVELGEGTVIGAMSFVNKSTDAWKIYAGIPAKPIKGRKKSLLRLEREFMKENKKK
jgi:acetyltransferase-like isoleucine patch superfamily enzyme